MWINPKAVAGTINLIYGSVKIGLGISTLILASPLTIAVPGAATVTIPAGLVGGFNIVTGFYRAVRGAGQITEAVDEPYVKSTAGEWTMDVIWGLLPDLNGGLPGILGGL